MNQRERDEAKRELQHALDALDDGAGRELWGPGAVLDRLAWRDGHAYAALYVTSGTLYNLLGLRTREQCIRGCRALAPVMLDLLLAEQPDDDGA